MGIYKVKDRRGRRLRRQQVLAERIRSAQNVRPQPPERTGAPNSSGVQHPGRHLEATQAGARRREPHRLDGPQFLRAFFRGVLQTSHALSVRSLNAILGKIPLKEFQRKDLYRHGAQRKKQGKPATVNRDVAAISKLFFYTFECICIRWCDGQHDDMNAGANWRTPTPHSPASIGFSTT